MCPSLYPHSQLKGTYFFCWECKTTTGVKSPNVFSTRQKHCESVSCSTHLSKSPLTLHTVCYIPILFTLYSSSFLWRNAVNNHHNASGKFKYLPEVFYKKNFPSAWRQIEITWQRTPVAARVCEGSVRASPHAVEHAYIHHQGVIFLQNDCLFIYFCYYYYYF